jgi:hypothetical protein
MEFFCSPEIQQKLQEIQNLLPLENNNVQVNFSQNLITISDSIHNHDIILSSQQKPKLISPDLENIINDIYQAEVIFDYEITMEDNLNRILAYIGKKDNPNGQKIIMLSHLGKKIKNEYSTNRKKIRSIIEVQTGLDGERIIKIAKRAYQFIQVIGDFPIREITKVTPKWLYGVRQKDFDQMLKMCKERELIEFSELANLNFAGAQS